MSILFLADELSPFEVLLLREVYVYIRAVVIFQAILDLFVSDVE